jgi:hypothetical protein
MSAEPGTSTEFDARRVLVVADWTVDPRRIVDDLSARNRHGPATFGLLVPSRLGALDWIGDPTAARPCAERQLARLEWLAALRGVRITESSVGDPESAPAVDDALADWPAGEIVLFDRERRVSLTHPFSLGRRLERRTGLPVERVIVPPSESRGRRSRPLGRSAPHCAAQPA